MDTALDKAQAGAIDPSSGSSRKWVILISNCIFLICVCTGLTAWSVASEPLAEAFQLGSVEIMAGAAVFVAGFTISSAIWGKLIGKIGFKKVVLIGVIINVISQLLIPGCDNYALILVLRFFMGFGVLTVPVYYIVGLWFPEKQRGMAIGVLCAIFYLGYALGGLIAGFMVPELGWQMTFYILAIFTVVGTVIWFIFNRMPKPEEVPWENLEDTSASASDTGAAPAKKQKSIWKSPALYIVGIIYFVIYFIEYATYDMSAIFLGAQNFDMGQIGTLLFVSSSIGVVAGPVSGVIADAVVKKNPGKPPHAARTKVMLAGAVIIMAIGCFLTPVLGVMGFVLAAICLLIVGWGGPFMDVATTSIGLDFFGPERGDQVISAMILLGGFAGVLSPILTTWLGETVSWTAAWVLMGIVSVVAIFACAALIKMKPESTEK